MSPLVKANMIAKNLGTTLALGGVSISITAGEVVAVVGPSGCGKSTLLQVLAGLLEPDEGSVEFQGNELYQLSDHERSRIRLRHFGFAFQFGELVPELTLQENIELPLRLTGVSHRDARQQSEALLSELQIETLAARRPGAVSGGQAQRAAIARAMIHRPSVIFADEPTGALDSKSGAGVLEAMLALAQQRDTAVLIVTHDHHVAEKADRIVEMRDGCVVSESKAVA